MAGLPDELIAGIRRAGNVPLIFRIPGMGTHFVNSAINRDYSLVLGVVIVYATLIVFFNLVVDIAYAMLDPRVRLGG